MVKLLESTVRHPLVSQKKILYLIRHAEGEGNVSMRRLDSTAPLTENGKKQALLLAKRCTELKPTQLLSSPVSRAFETALCIGKECGLIPQPLPVLSERRRPSELDGLKKQSKKAKAVDLKLRLNFHLPQWRYSNEENFEDLKERCQEVLRILEATSSERIIAVTHGILIRIIVACALFENLDGATCESFIRGFRMAKTGITALSVNFNTKEEGIASKYQLWLWNDHIHLGGDK